MARKYKPRFPKLELLSLEDRAVPNFGVEELPNGERYPDGQKRPDGTVRGWVNKLQLEAQGVVKDYAEFLADEVAGRVPQTGGPVDNEPGAVNVLVNNDGPGTLNGFTQSETSIAVLPGNTIVIGFNDSGSNAGGANKFTGFARSIDGGATWTDGGTLPTNPGGDAGDPVLAHHVGSNNLYFATLGFNVNNIQVFRSTNGGATWSLPVNGTPGGSGFMDKQWMAVDNFAGAGNGNVYIIARDFGAANSIRFWRSIDGGATFSGGGTIASGSPSNVQGAYVAVGPDHSVYAFYFDENALPETIKMRRSTDGGLTFGPAVTVATLGTGPGFNGDMALTGQRNGIVGLSAFRSNAFPAAVVNPVNGHLYVTYGDNPAGADKADVFFRMSTDNGATWSAATRVNSDAGANDQWQPSIAVTPDGSKVGVFWYDRREDTGAGDGDPANNQYKYYGRVGAVSGGTVLFGADFPVSDVPSRPEFGRDSFVNGVYMGDYDQAAATNDAFHVVWADNRDSLIGGVPRMDPDIRYKKITLGLAVVATTPAVGSTVATSPTQYDVIFSEPIDATSLQASDFTVNSLPATGVTLNGAGTAATFTFAADPVTGQGLQTMAMAAGAVTRASDASPLAAFSGTFRYDSVALAITGTSPISPNGIIDTLPTGTIRVFFNEPIDPTSATASDFTPSQGVITSVTPVLGNTAVDVVLAGLLTEGTFTLTTFGGRFTDTAGNPNPAGFVGTYQLDYVSRPFPTPLLPKAPAGSLIYDPTISGLINAGIPGGDADSFTLNLDAGQTVTIRVTASATLRPSVELLSPADASLGSATAPAAGQAAILQTGAAAGAGTYKVRVTGFGGTTGTFTVQVILNSALEAEGNTPGATNNTPATAQNINGSFIGLDPGLTQAQRGAVLGAVDATGYVAAAVPFTFTDISASGTDLITAGDDLAAGVGIPFGFNFYGTTYASLFASSNGLVTFGTADSSFSNGSLVSTPAAAALAPFWDDLYVFNGNGNARVKTQTIGPVGSRQFIVQWDKVNFFPDSTGTDTMTFQAVLFEGTNNIQFNYPDLVSGASFGNNGASATVGIKAANPTNGQFLQLALNNGPNEFVGTGKSTLITRPAPTPDLYSFTAAAGDTVTLAITNLVAGNVDVALLAPDGTTVLATGTGPSININESIQNFAVPAAGTYYARVSGDGTIPYSLVVNRNAAFDREDNNTIATAQSTGSSLGALGAITAAASSAPINNLDTGWIASDGSHGTTNNNYFTGQAAFGGNPTATLRNYASFALSAALPTITAAQLRLFQPTNGYISPDPTETYTVFDVSATPAQLDTERFAGDPVGIALHADLGSGAVYGSAVVSPADNGTQIVISLNAAGVAALNAARGSSIALGGALTSLAGTAQQSIFAFTSGGPTAVQLVLATAAETDLLAVTLAADQTALRATSRTPADGGGEFVNTLNPTVEILDGAGIVIATGAVLPDGRNESALATGLTAGGTYYVRVGGQAATRGEYVLMVKHAPTDIAISSDTVLENLPVGSVVGTLTATDDGSSLTFTLVGGAGDEDNGAFYIDGDQLKTAVVLNRETLENLSIRVRVTDAGGLGYEEAMPLTVLDAPEAAFVHGHTGGVAWDYNPVTDHLLVTGRAVAADNIGLATVPTPANAILKLLANGAETAFDGSAAPAIYAHRWNHLQVIHLDGVGGNDTMAAGSGGVGLPTSAYEVAELDGMAGNDSLVGGDGPDVMTGEAGNDVMYGGDGDDRMTGGIGADTQDGGDGADTYRATNGEAQFDVFNDTGLGGPDTLENYSTLGLVLNGFSSTNGIDVVDGNGTHVRGDGAANVLDFRAARLVDVQYVDGQGGNDLIYASHQPASNASFEGYFGHTGNDSLVGGDAADKLFGEAGNDSIVGGLGNDSMQGGAGNDILDGQAGSDLYAAILAEARLDTMSDSGASGTDTLKNVGTPYLGENANGDLTLNGFSPANGIEVVDADGFAILGDSGNNTFDFRAATLVDVEFVSGAGGNDVIYASDAAVVNDGALPAFAGYRGGTGNDSLFGGAAGDLLLGEDGNDSMQGGGGADTMSGGNGIDTMTGGTGDDVFYLGLLSGPVLDDDSDDNGIDDDEEGLVPHFIG